jgi:hypothetical protein
MNQPITSIDELVTAFGGPTALGDWLGVGASAVSNWQARGNIPTGWHLRLYLECERRKLPVDLAVFGFDGADLALFTDRQRMAHDRAPGSAPEAA